MSDAAIATVVSGLVTCTTMVVGFLTLWVKLRYGVEKAEDAVKKVEVVENKIDHNTDVTLTGNRNATEAAKAAATASREVCSKLNGGVDAAIAEAIAPLQKQLSDHANADEVSIRQVTAKVDSLASYVHQRNHDILNAMAIQANRIETLLAMLQQQQAKKA